MAGGACYQNLADEYEVVLGWLARRTWRQGVLAEVARLGSVTGLVVDLGAGTGIGGQLLDGVVGGRRVGIDRSEPMLRRASGSYEGTVLADAVDLPLRRGSADLVVSAFDTLNYLEPDALGRCLRAVGRCLRPGGWFVFDYSSPVLLRRELSRSASVPRGIVHLWHRYLPEPDRSVSVVERRGIDGSVSWRETHVHYAAGADQLHRLVAAAGLEVALVRNLDGRAFSLGANAHVWVLRKPLHASAE